MDGVGGATGILMRRVGPYRPLWVGLCPLINQLEVGQEAAKVLEAGGENSWVVGIWRTCF